MDEEEIRKPSGRIVGQSLEGLSVAELEAYLAELRGEIRRVEAELARRRDIRGAAEALFGRPGGPADGR